MPDLKRLLQSVPGIERFVALETLTLARRTRPSDLMFAYLGEGTI